MGGMGGAGGGGPSLHRKGTDNDGPTPPQTKANSKHSSAKLDVSSILPRLKYPDRSGFGKNHNWLCAKIGSHASTPQQPQSSLKQFLQQPVIALHDKLIGTD